MSRIVSLDRSKFDDQRRKMEREFEKKLRDLKSEAREKTIIAAIHVADLLAHETFPSAGSIGMAAAAVRFDVGRVYIVAGKAYEILQGSTGGEKAGKGFYAAFKRNDLATAREILRKSGSPIANIIIGAPLDPSLHEKGRNQKTGRVMLSAPLQIVTSSEVSAFAKLTIARLGKTASGWSACAEKLGGSGNETRWKGTAVHGSDGGKVNVRHNKTKVSYVLTNLRPLAKKLISPGQVNRVMKEGRELLSRLLSS
jgi:hypothetical protein